ncbi:glycosyltransferase [Aeromicrobium terrae]|uniref:Glycosyltransferase n=1 Tax=Aeromicrobium terrae TaxID=2498846 RepID=A0A5C8NKT0_9ACTN|nr:glycosyltransferase [Aeromicrobium terrae]TXL61862.1 glycosyltransferase [Aeromicrobium terrae]
MSEVPERVAIAIVTFNRSTYLQELLTSAAAMTTPAWKIVVVDNASTDDTQEVLAAAQADFPEGVLVNHRLDTNTGGSGGFSEGTKVALELGADWVWLMDDDVEIIPDALDRFAPWMKRFQVIHGRRYDFDGSPFYWQAKFNQFLGVPLPYSVKTFDQDGYAVTNSGTFEGMLIHADIVRMIGLPDPRFFISWDDAAYAWLAAQHTQVVYVDTFVLKRKREQQQVNLGIRHLNDGSPLFRFHVIRNRAYVGKYFAEYGKLNRFGFGLGTALTLAKEVFRLIVVQHTLKGLGDLRRGFKANREIWRDDSWKPMDPADVPKAIGGGAGPRAADGTVS